MLVQNRKNNQSSRKVMTADSDLAVRHQLNEALIAVGNHKDSAAFSFLFSQMFPRLKHFALSKVRDPDTAFELAQETLSIVWQKANLFDVDKGCASTWIFTILRNLAFDMLRKKERQSASLDSQVLWPMEADLVEDEGKDLLTVQRSEISDVIDSLPENQQQIVKFVYVDDLTHQEVAEKTKLPLGTVKSRLRLALEKMRKVLC